MDFNFVHTNGLVAQQLKSSLVAKARASKDGHWYAALIANNPRIVQSFEDHEVVAEALKDAGEVQSLFNIASGGFLDGPSSRAYREAYKAASAA